MFAMGFLTGVLERALVRVLRQCPLSSLADAGSALTQAGCRLRGPLSRRQNSLPEPCFRPGNLLAESSSTNNL